MYINKTILTDLDEIMLGDSQRNLVLYNNLLPYISKLILFNLVNTTNIYDNRYWFSTYASPTDIEIKIL